MARYEHLHLSRLPENLNRRKTGRPPPLPKRGADHGGAVRHSIDTAVTEQRAERPASFVDPSLILRVKMSGMAMEEDWEKVDLHLLSSDENNTIILFSSTEELTAFRQKLNEYDTPIPVGQKNRRHAGFIDRIAEIDTLQPSDRLGIRLLERGFVDVTDFQDNETYVVDIELWDFGRHELRRRKAEEIGEFIESQGGEVFDTYVGPSLTVIRVEAFGNAIRPILSVPEVAVVDLPPQPDLEAQPLIEMALDDLPTVEASPDTAPIIGILDSGINAHPLLSDVLVASEAFPPEINIADVWGHGTRVGGAAVFGDMREQMAAGIISKSARLVSAKIITDQGNFFERRTLPTQMRTVFTRLNTAYGCRIFVISLGDTLSRLELGRVGPWAMTLDELARELNVLIFVSAGNRSPRGGTSVEQSVTQYPNYLLEETNKVFEPAGAANVVTVGSISHGSGLGPGHTGDAHVQPITNEMEPSPFTRTGPGAAGITKPDFVDHGGTLIYDAVTRSLRSAPQVPEAGIITLNHTFTSQLFTSQRGTSYSAPILARKAALLLSRFPDASANLIRALLAGAAQIPDEAARLLSDIGATDQARILGNGYVDPQKAAYSDDHRVVFYAEERLETDKFAIYSVPIPTEFQSGGKRTIRVSLAFDPPVRRTRADYLGTRMNFRLIRGRTDSDVSDHFRSYAGEDGIHPNMPNRFNCGLIPGPRMRDGNTLQSAEVSYIRDTVDYGDHYYLIVRCVAGWAEEQTHQNFAVVVELEHQKNIQLYARLRPRVRV